MLLSLLVGGLVLSFSLAGPLMFKLQSRSTDCGDKNVHTSLQIQKAALQWVSHLIGANSEYKTEKEQTSQYHSILKLSYYSVLSG